MTENSSLPEPTPVTIPAAESPAIAPGADPIAVAAPRRSRTRTLFIAGGAALAAAVLAGGGVAVGTAIADDADDDDDRSSASSPSADIGSDSASELSEIVGAASDSAHGVAVGIEANPDGSWDVQFETSGGEETEVRVAADGTAEVVSTDAADVGDSAPQGVLDADTVDALVTAALAEVDGRVTGLEIDDDPASPFDISVVQSNGRALSLDLDADMKVLSINDD